MNRSRLSKPECVFGAFVLFALTTVATPNIFKSFANARRANTIMNAKQLGIALTEFDSLYGEFPSSRTAKEISEKEGIKLLKGESANQFLAQLIFSRVLDTEHVFFVDGMKRTQKADNHYGTPNTTLTRGENGFGYVMLSDGEALSQSHGSSLTPVLVAPVLKGGKLPTFQERPFHGEGVVLRLDSSVGVNKISKKGELLSKNSNQNIFKNGQDTLWGVETPVVKEPWLLPEEQKKEAK